MWGYFVIIYLIFAVLFTQSYKIVLKTSEGKGAITVLLQLLSGIIALLFCPFFITKFPSDYTVYIYLGISLIFYAISDRLNTSIRKGIEASTYSIIKQLTTVFMILAGLIFLKEPVVVKKIIGSILILFSNFLVFYNPKGTTFNKYVILAIISNIISASALFIGVSFSDNFNIAFYAALTVIIPAILIYIFERIKLSDVKKEWTSGNKKAIIFTCIGWGVMLVAQLRAYQLGKVTQVAPLSALTVILNVLVGYIFLKEKNNLFKKIIAAILIIISIFLIKG
jgi:Predicted membrane protein